MCFSLFFIADNSLYEVKKDGELWELKERKHPYAFHCLSLDPTREGRLYAGSFDHGLLFSDDYGRNFQKVGEGISSDRVLSLAVSIDEDGRSRVWAGTEPSELFCSKDGGKSWTNFPELPKLPSHTSWSFPPRPYTHHVQSIQVDLLEAERIFVGIELGGVMRSMDGGETWEDRKEASQHDCHTLTMNEKTEDRIYEAAGGGFAESRDGGATWKTDNEGLGDYTYLVDIQTDPDDGDVIIASAAKSARTAYQPSRAHTVLVRKEGDAPWEIISEGLPVADGSSIFSLISRPQEGSSFYAVNNLGLYHSIDQGRSWEKVPLRLPGDFKEKRIRALVAS